MGMVLAPVNQAASWNPVAKFTTFTLFKLLRLLKKISCLIYIFLGNLLNFLYYKINIYKPPGIKDYVKNILLILSSLGLHTINCSDLTSKLEPLVYNKILLSSAESGDLKKVQEALGNGANIEARDQYLWTALIYATYKDHEEIVKLLINNKADVNVKEHNGDTPLWKTNNLKTAQLLIESGTDINAKSNQGYTVLMTTYHDIKKFKFLIKNGADINAKNDAGETAFEIFDRLNYTKQVNLLKEWAPYSKAYYEDKETGFTKYSIEVDKIKCKSNCTIHNDILKKFRSIFSFGSFKTCYRVFRSFI